MAQRNKITKQSVQIGSIDSLDEFLSYFPQYDGPVYQIDTLDKSELSRGYILSRLLVSISNSAIFLPDEQDYNQHTLPTHNLGNHLLIGVFSSSLSSPKPITSSDPNETHINVVTPLTVAYSYAIQLTKYEEYLKQQSLQESATGTLSNSVETHLTGTQTTEVSSQGGDQKAKRVTRKYEKIKREWRDKIESSHHNTVIQTTDISGDILTIEFSDEVNVTPLMNKTLYIGG